MENIKVGDFEVFDSGCVTSIHGQDILLTLKENIRIRVQFLSTEDRKQSMNMSVNEDSTELIVRLSNFNNPLGTEFTNAIEIGNIDSRKLLIHLRVIGMNEGNNRVLFYTFLLGEMINNG